MFFKEHSFKINTHIQEILYRILSGFLNGKVEAGAAGVGVGGREKEYWKVDVRFGEDAIEALTINECKEWKETQHLKQEILNGTRRRGGSGRD